MANRKRLHGGDCCSAIACHNARSKQECQGLSFFRYPSDEERCRKWVENTGRQDLVGKSAAELSNGGYRMCTLHFEPGQFTVPREKKRLNWQAVPTLFNIPKATRGRGGPPCKESFHFQVKPRRKRKCLQTAHLESIEMETDMGGHGFGSDTVKREEPAVKSEVESDSEDAGGGMKAEVLLEVKMEPEDLNWGGAEEEGPTVRWGLDIDVDEAEDWPRVSFEGCSADNGTSADEPTVETEVKVEIDVAEDPSVCWGTMAEKHGSSEGTVTSETAGVHMQPSPPSSSALLGYDSCVWVKEEAPDPCTVAFDVNPDSESSSGKDWGTGPTSSVLKKDTTASSHTKPPSSSSAVVSYDSCVWIKQDIPDPSELKKDTDVDIPSLCATGKRKGTKRAHDCSQCGVVFATPSKLKAHVLIHTGEKPHVCPHCSVAFRMSNDLKRHILTHTGEKPHVCRQCSVAFRMSNDLKRHILTHTGEKPHICQECGAGFTTPSKLKAHALTHTGERPHVCPHCTASFRYADDRKRIFSLTQERNLMSVESVVLDSRRPVNWRHMAWSIQE